MDILSRYEDVFVNAVIDKGEEGSSKDNELFEVMKDAYCRIHNHPSGYKIKLRLLKHENASVRSWVAAQILCENERYNALEVLQDAAKRDDMIGFNSQITLEEYLNGRILSPFGIKT